MKHVCGVYLDSPVAHSTESIPSAHSGFCGRPAFQRVTENRADGTWCCDDHAESYVAKHNGRVVEVLIPPVSQEDVDAALASIMAAFK